MEKSLEVTQKIKNRTTLRLGNSTSGYLPKESQNTHLKRPTHPYVHCSAIYNSQDIEATQVPINRLDKEVVAYTYNGMLLSHKTHTHNTKSYHFQQHGWTRRVSC